MAERDRPRGRPSRVQSLGHSAWGGDSWEMNQDSWVRARSWRDFVQKKGMFFYFIT